MACHRFASSMRAPAPKAVICVLTFEDSPNFLATKHQLDVGSPFGREDRHPQLLGLDHIADPIHPATGWPLLVPISPCRPSFSLPYGRLAMPCTWRTDGFSTFYAIDRLRQLRRILDAGDTTAPCRHVSDLQPAHSWQPVSATTSAYSLFRLVPFDDA